MRQMGPTRSASFLGREEELALIRTALEQAGAGGSTHFLITGEAGMGKTRLTEEAGAVARSQGHQVLWGRCWEAVDSPAYWPWVQVLRQVSVDRGDPDSGSAPVAGADIAKLLGRLGQPAGDTSATSAAPGHSRFALFDSVASGLRIATGNRTTLIILEDLHAADESSLQLLQFVTMQHRSTGLVVVGTYDDVAVRSRAAHVRILSDIAREGHLLSLKGLDQGAVSQLYADAAGQPPSDAIARAVHEASEGNPLFVQEAIRMLLAKGDIRRPDYSIGFRVPEGVRGIVRRRLEGLSDDVTELLSVASVIGREFGLDGLQKVVDIEIDALLDMLEKAVAAEVISETSALGRYAFKHILLRESLYEDLTAAKRMRLHRTVADVLEETDPAIPQVSVAELAHHWFKAAQAGDTAKTLRYAMEAAEQAMSQHAYEEALRLYQRAFKVSSAAGADPEVIDKIRSGLAVARSIGAPQGKPAVEVASGVFLREGDYWTIAYAGQETRLKDVTGLRYIAQLLKSPGREIHVLDLAGLVKGHSPAAGKRDVANVDDLASEGLGDAGEILDPKAKAAYKRRLDDLRDEVEEAQRFNDPERAARAQLEIEPWWTSWPLVSVSGVGTEGARPKPRKPASTSRSRSRMGSEGSTRVTAP